MGDFCNKETGQFRLVPVHTGTVCHLNPVHAQA